MRPESRPANKTLIEKILLITRLCEDERVALSALPFHTCSLRPGKTIISVGDRPTSCFIILAGFVTSSKISGTSSAGYTGIHIAGDMPDLFGLYLDEMDIDMRAASGCTLAFVEHAAVRRLCGDHPRLNGALWRLTLTDAAVLREWIINVGHRDAIVRLAHLFCEIHMRMLEVGLAPGDVCDFPFTQAELADATGMSTVHVNRSLQQLRALKLVSFDGKKLAILDWAGLAAQGDFQANYLHHGRGTAAAHGRASIEERTPHV